MALGDLLVVGTQDRVYRRSGGMWDSGIALPSGERSPVGLDVDPTNGDILLTGTNTDRIYRYSGGSWDSGIVIPTSLLGIQGPTGLAVHPTNGRIYLTGNNTSHSDPDKVVYYSGANTWSQLSGPSGELRLRARRELRGGGGRRGCLAGQPGRADGRLAGCRRAGGRLVRAVRDRHDRLESAALVGHPSGPTHAGRPDR